MQCKDFCHITTFLILNNRRVLCVIRRPYLNNNTTRAIVSKEGLCAVLDPKFHITYRTRSVKEHYVQYWGLSFKTTSRGLGRKVVMTGESCEETLSSL